MHGLIDGETKAARNEKLKGWFLSFIAANGRARYIDEKSRNINPIHGSKGWKQVRQEYVRARFLSNYVRLLHSVAWPPSGELWKNNTIIQQFSWNPGVFSFSSSREHIFVAQRVSFQRNSLSGGPSMERFSLIRKKGCGERKWMKKKHVVTRGAIATTFVSQYCRLGCFDFVVEYRDIACPSAKLSATLLGAFYFRVTCLPSGVSFPRDRTVNQISMVYDPGQPRNPSRKFRVHATRNALTLPWANLESSSTEILIKFGTIMCKHASTSHLCGSVIRASFSARHAAVIHLMSRPLFIIACSSLGLRLFIKSWRIVLTNLDLLPHWTCVGDLWGGTIIRIVRRKLLCAGFPLSKTVRDRIRRIDRCFCVQFMPVDEPVIYRIS